MSLAARGRAKLDAGVLTRERPEKFFAAYGADKPCTACDAAILPSEAEWSIRDEDRMTHRFHVGGYGLCEAECRSRGWRIAGG